MYDRRPHAQMTLLAAMDAACDDITAESCRGWIRHSRRYFPRCIARDNIRCDVDENMWPDRNVWMCQNDFPICSVTICPVILFTFVHLCLF